MVNPELVFLGIAVVYGVIATLSIIRLSSAEDEGEEGDEGGPHTYQ